MKRYQICETLSKDNNAGRKAPQDIISIAKKLGYSVLETKMRSQKSNNIIASLRRQIGYVKDWTVIYKSVKKNAVILLQCPGSRQWIRQGVLKNLKKNKNIRIIALVHDVYELRLEVNDKFHRREFQSMVEIADSIIVHNNIMKDFFIAKGVQKEKLIVLEIFDYLQKERKVGYPKYEKSITIAGNLNPQKAGYIKHLGELDKIKIYLFGSGYDSSMDCYAHISYGGSFPPEQIPLQLNKGFGLVWDGDDIIGCTGENGQYLRYNNPHKLSLYLSSGLPVVIWKEAAEADFVKKYNLGICVDTLEDLDNVFAHLTKDDYFEMCKNVHEIGKKLRKGYYSTQAILNAEKVIEIEYE